LVLSYLELAGGAIPARGIRCGDGLYVLPDEQVMASFLHVAHVELVPEGDDAYFQLTDAGRAYLGLFPAS
jgi:hypothetical protein